MKKKTSTQPKVRISADWVSALSSLLTLLVAIASLYWAYNSGLIDDTLTKIEIKSEKLQNVNESLKLENAKLDLRRTSLSEDIDSLRLLSMYLDSLLQRRGDERLELIESINTQQERYRTRTVKLLSTIDSLKIALRSYGIDEEVKLLRQQNNELYRIIEQIENDSNNEAKYSISSGMKSLHYEIIGLQMQLHGVSRELDACRRSRTK